MVTIMNNNRYIVTSPKTITDYMPSLFVEKVRAATNIGDHVKFTVQDSYSIDGSSRMVDAKVLGKTQHICITDKGTFTWIDIALYDWKNLGALEREGLI